MIPEYGTPEFEEAVKKSRERGMRLREKYGFIYCPKCNTGHTCKTVWCRECNYKVEIPKDGAD